MDDEVLQKFGSFNLSSQEGIGFELQISDVNVGEEDCKKSMIWKVYGNKLANFVGVKNALTRVWGSRLISKLLKWLQIPSSSSFPKLKKWIEYLLVDHGFLIINFWFFILGKMALIL